VATLQNAGKYAAASKIDRIDILNRHKLTKLNSIVGLSFDAFKLLLCNLDVIALRKLKAARTSSDRSTTTLHTGQIIWLRTRKPHFFVQ
jgi:hypothetical protein